jgi:carbon monoxide dehydrogenase subunit G
MDFESKWQNINASATQVFSFLNDLRNLEKLMPEQIIDYKAEAQKCSFTIKGMTSLSLKVDQAIEPKLIRLVPDGKSPFEFELMAHLRESEGTTQAKIQLQAELNPMLAMMAKRPLQNLVEIMADKLSAQSF